MFNDEECGGPMRGSCTTCGACICKPPVSALSIYTGYCIVYNQCLYTMYMHVQCVCMSYNEGINYAILRGREEASHSIMLLAATKLFVSIPI